MNNKACDKVLRKSVHGAFAYLSTLVCTILAGISIANLFVNEVFSNWNVSSLFSTVLAGVVLLDAIVLWMIPLSQKKSNMVLASLLKFVKIILFAGSAVVLVLLAVSIALYGENQGLTRNLGDVGQFLENFTLEGVIGIAASFAFALIYECLACAFVLSVGTVYKGKKGLISGRFLSVFSFINMVLSIVCIPVIVFFEDIALQLGINTDIINVPQVSFDFGQYSIQDGLNLAGLVLTPLMWFFVALMTKKYADNKKTLKDALDGKIVTDATNSMESQNTFPYAAPVAAAAAYEVNAISQSVAPSDSFALPSENDYISNAAEYEAPQEDQTDAIPMMPIGVDVSEEADFVDSEKPVSFADNQEVNSDNGLSTENASGSEEDEIADSTIVAPGHNDEQQSEAELSEESETELSSEALDSVTESPVIAAVPVAAVTEVGAMVDETKKPDAAPSTQQPVPYVRSTQPAAPRVRNPQNKPKLIPGTRLYDFGYSENSII